MGGGRRSGRGSGTRRCVSFTYANMHAGEAEMTCDNAITTSKQLKWFYVVYSHQQPTRAFSNSFDSVRPGD